MLTRILNRHHGARIERFHFVLLGFKNRHKGNPLGGKSNHLVCLIIMTGTNTMRIPHHKKISISNHAGNTISAIPALCRLRDDMREIETFGN
ncbi:MAG TPA: hypothetical protein DDW68_09995 [Verrucomicrobiales bacterium]|nr:hypothetical protein [Verrucomicrobiales bacterium]